MPSAYSASTFFSAFRAAYGTMDVRAALVFNQGKWLLVALSAHIRVVSSDVAEREFREAVTRFGAIESAIFRIFQRCCPISEVDDFFSNMAKGELVLNGSKMILTDPADMLVRHGSIKNNRFGNEGSSWPSIETQHIAAKDERLNLMLLNDGEISRVVEIAGYKDPHSAVRALLDIDFESSSSAGVLWVKCDIPVRLSRPEVSKSGSVLQLSFGAEGHSAVKDLSCNIHWTNPYRSNQSGQVRLKFDPVASDLGTMSWSGRVDVPLKRDDSVVIDIVSSAIGKLYWINTRPFDYLPPEQRNPLLAALQLFCSAEQMALLLSEPQRATVGGSNEARAQKLFEVSVQWLLSVLGLQAICLQGYEKFKEPGMEYGTLDCLAYSEDEDLLLLAHCSIGPPNPNELSKYANLEARVKHLLFSDEKVHIRSALFTASFKPPVFNHQNISVFYRDDIEALLQTAKSGQKLNYLRHAFFARLVDR